MEDKLNTDSNFNPKINGIPEKSFSGLNDEQKNIVLTGNNSVQDKSVDGGKIGKIIGTNPQNASINIALILSCIMLIFCGLDILHFFCKDTELTEYIWDKGIPIITLSLGYIFGKGGNKKQ